MFKHFSDAKKEELPRPPINVGIGIPASSPMAFKKTLRYCERRNLFLEVV